MGTTCSIRQECICDRLGNSWIAYAVQRVGGYLYTSCFRHSCKSLWCKERGISVGIADGICIVGYKPAYEYLADKCDAYGFRRLYH